MNEVTDNVETETSMISAEAPVVDERPEWLPEKFKSPEDLVSSYSALETKLGKGQEEIRQSVKDEMLAETFKERPETAGDYVLPEVIDESQAVDNELLNWWSEFCFEHGYGQDKFADGIAKYATAIQEAIPDIEQEREKLGENADARIEAVQLWANKFFDESHMGALERLGQTSEGIEVLEKVMEAMKGSSLNGTSETQSGITEEDLKSMMNDPRYWKQGARDSGFVQQVNDGFAKLYRQGSV